MITKNQIKFVRSLHQKKFRITHECFVVESHKNVLEIINSDYEIINLFATKNWLELNHIDFLIPINEVTEKEMQRITAFKSYSEVLVVVKMPLENIDYNFSGVNIVLDDVKDPGNLGTIIRICDWFGVKNIYCSEETVDMYNPKVIQSTMGSFSRVNVVYTNLDKLLNEVPDFVDVFAAVMNGSKLGDVEIKENLLIFFGNESHGISEELLKKIKNKITIIKVGQAESLNVSVSASIILNYFCT